MMPAPTAYSSSQPSHIQPLYPALYLYPLNDSFIPKHITLLNSQRVKIGRQTNAKTVPAERNGYFDSKVLSRQHAEVWEENGKIFIKDVKSSNGTFINGERLSAEGLESEPYELKSDDIVEFGIDIVAEDNKTIIHHKVAARVLCVFSEQDVQMAARAEAHQQQQSQHPSSSSLSQSSLSPTGPSNVPQVFGFQSGRRPPTQPQLGGMGGAMRPPGSSKTGLTFDHILTRLQGELQKSRDTSAELSNLTSTLSEIGEVLGGNLPQNPPPYPQNLPFVRPPPEPLSQDQPPAPAPEPGPSVSLEALTDLQSQLQASQSSLTSHQEKIHALEGVLQDHETLKREVSILKGVMESLRVDGEADVGNIATNGDEEDLDPDADTRSITTIVPRPHELESVQEEDEDQLMDDAPPYSPEKVQEVMDDENDEERSRRRDELGRPRTPEPSSLGLDLRRSPTRHKNTQPHPRLSPPSSSAIEDLNRRLTTLSAQLESAIELSSTLQAQHAAAQGTIRVLEEKVERLEELVRNASSPASQTASSEHASLDSTSRESERETLMQLFTTFQRSVESQWSSVRSEFLEGRERLGTSQEHLETKMKVLENSLEEIRSFRSFGKAVTRAAAGNGDIKGGLVTPPSPRSLSSDSSARRLKRRGRSSRSLPRSRGRSASQATSTTLASESEGDSDHVITAEDGDQDDKSNVFPITPDASVRLGSGSTTDSVASSTGTSHSEGEVPLGLDLRKDDFTDADTHLRTMSAVIGVFVLGVAAGAVLWRVKSE